jgi:amino acid transporter
MVEDGNRSGEVTVVDAKPSESPNQPFGFISLVALVVASMIGSGVFTTSGFAMGDLKDARLVVAVWCIGGVVALCGAIGYGALAARLPGSGGEYLYLSRAIHPAIGFLAGWISLVAGFTVPMAAAAKTFATYFVSGWAEGESERGLW